ncbi:hypothetical protein [Massilia violaceinigra]|uniref:hypothetical protein n=1 Tax=Massilia violaceinigra TaxID=2045208 RepID=UPI0012FE6CB0|nr:hypothetical protein [Massilia violaceinigra]
MRRPWGHIDRWFTGDVARHWDFIGTCGFEDRSTTALELMKQYVKNSIFLKLDPASPRLKEEVVGKIEKNSKKIVRIFPAIKFFEAELLDPPQDFIDMIDDWLATGPKKIVIDMSAMPKRFFVVLLKRILGNKGVEEVLVTYTIPERYTASPLAEDQAPVRTFQAFSKESLVDVQLEHVVVGLGYMAFDLTNVLDSTGYQPKTSVLFPFPPGAPSFQRNWKLLNNLFGTGEEFPEPIRIDSRDVSYAFDVIDDITSAGTEACLLLPFGPKPHSLAMILHSIYRNSEVRYTQPTFYHPDYSTGVKKIAGREEVYVYAIRLDSVNLFAD